MKYQIEGITIAITDMDAMLHFYQAVFEIELTENTRLSKRYGAKLYSGSLGEMKLLFCPNSLSQVEAQQSRVQFDIVALNIESVMARAKKSGGTLQGELMFTPKQKIIAVVDPDGNTLVLKEYTSSMN